MIRHRRQPYQHPSAGLPSQLGRKTPLGLARAVVEGARSEVQNLLTYDKILGTNQTASAVMKGTGRGDGDLSTSNPSGHKETQHRRLPTFAASRDGHELVIAADEWKEPASRLQAGNTIQELGDKWDLKCVQHLSVIQDRPGRFRLNFMLTDI